MSLRRVSRLARGGSVRPLVADDILEFHAARLVLLLHHCGTRGQIVGLTKLAKLDFFVRYPKFFARVGGTEDTKSVPDDSPMVRHHYGPWDHRYYQVLAFLESTRLVDVDNDASSYSVTLTSAGLSVAQGLSQEEPFRDLVAHMKAVRKQLGRKSGTALKKLIYREFDTEVTRRPLGDVI